MRPTNLTSGQLLKSLLKINNITRDNFAYQIKVSENTLDSWLDSNIRPSDSNIHIIARELAKNEQGVYHELSTKLHRHYILCDICNRLAEKIGRPSVVDLAQELVKLVVRLDSKFEELKNSNSLNDSLFLVQMFLQGVKFPGVQNVFYKLSLEETDPEWKIDIQAACVAWYIRLQQKAPRWAVSDDAGSAGLASSLSQVNDGESSLYVTNERLEALINKDPGIFQDILEGNLGNFDKYLEDDIPDLRLAVKQNPHSADCHFELGSRLGKMGEKLGDEKLVEEGIQECRIAADLEPQWDTPRAEIGIILINVGRIPEAVRELEESVRVFGRLSPHMANVLGSARMRNKDYQGASEMFDKVIAMEPNWGQTLDDAAYCCFKTGDRQKAIDLAKRAKMLGFVQTHDEWRSGN